MHIAAFVGPSGSGKTTLICELTRHFVALGRTVGAIKHTHHALNEDRRGDTAAFSDAGADPVIFAGEGEAVIFSGGPTRRITYHSPLDLLDQFTTEIVLIEGFKDVDLWPQIELDRKTALGVDGVLSILDRIWR
jgi:molybdopterin-guanine dinucleotide biosynthesis protein MobB